MNNLDSQNEELVALQSIYESKLFIVECMNPPNGRFYADVQLPDQFSITFKCDSAVETLEESIIERFDVEYLPPINLYFEFPSSYPSDSWPAFLLSCSWLTYDQLSKLSRHLECIWKESFGEVVLFQWIQFLKEETLSFLGIENELDITELSNFKINSFVSLNQNSSSVETSTSDYENLPHINKYSNIKPSIYGGSGAIDCRAMLDIADGKILKSMLKEYNVYYKGEIFKNSFHLCNICFTNKQGSEFIVFKTCGHYFCNDCVKSYFEVLIKDGNVHSLNCLQEKCSTQADGSLVKQIVSTEHFQKYDSLLLSRTLETMSDIAYCPRKACQCPVIIDVCGRMGTCPACKFVFCPFCKMVYHGVAPCNFSSDKKKQICEEYLEGSDAKKAELESRHGKRVIKTLVETVLSEGWINSNSKNCPSCNSSIEKNEGCNKITCFRCGTFFCWLCRSKLKASNPYSHYSERGSECYDKLFPPEYLFEEFMFEPGAFLNF